MFFETENLHSQETKNTFLISILQSAAQAESEARSQNIRWGIIRGLEKGSSRLYDRKCFGYRQDENGKLTMLEEEAETVRLIFNLYLKGYSILAIIRELEKRGIKSPTSRDCWSKRTIDTMLSNEKYTGNVLVGKTYCGDFPNNQRHLNNGEREKYLMTDSHSAIITEVLFECVQA